MKTRRTIPLLAIALLALLCMAAPAAASQVQPYFYSGTSFSPGSNGKAIAFDGVNQRVLTVGNTNGTARVNLFTAAGLTAPFTGIGGASSFVLPSQISFQQNTSTFSIAVDETSSATAGNFYIATTQPSKLYGYAPGGTPLPGFPLSLTESNTCGVGVDLAGNVWLGEIRSGTYRQYFSTGSPTGKALGFGTENGGCHIVFDSAGDSYAAAADRLVESDPSGKFLADVGAAIPGDFGLRGTALVLDRSRNSLFTLSGGVGADNRVAELDSTGAPQTDFGGPDPAHFSYPGLHGARDLAVNPSNHDVYALEEGSVDVFSRGSTPTTVPTVSTEPADAVTGTGVVLHGSVDPDGIPTSDCHFEWGTTVDYGHTAPCAEGDVFAGASGENQVSAAIGGLAKGESYHTRLVVANASGGRGLGRDLAFGAADPPIVGDTSVRHITSDSAQVNFDLNPNGAGASYHVKVEGPGGTANYPVPDVQPSSLGGGAGEGFGVTQQEANLKTQPKVQELNGLEPNVSYRYRIVATNAAGVTKGPFYAFKTFPATVPGDPCPNAHVRQQTGASLLLDCRAYELVSAANTGGYDVRSDLSSGVAPLTAYPEAPDRALYSMQSGTIPGIAGNPTNRGADPYVATRGSDGWSTKYVGIPANQPSAAPFASTLAGADAGLSTFAFAGADICNPCFADGSVGVPLHNPDGSLAQGMSGPIPVAGPVAAGTIKKPLSDDGSHLVFGSKQQFAAGANGNNSDVTIYDRNLKTNTTQVVSSTPAGTPIANGSGIAELDVSADGSRIVIGQLVSTDAAGNHYYHLYMHVGDNPGTLDLTPGATNGVLYDGMTSAGTMVYFTAKDALPTGAEQDTDSSADVYRADAGGASVTLTRVSTGGSGTGDTSLCNPVANSARAHWNSVAASPNCDAVAVGGGDGVASEDGTFYFLSPEMLDTSGATQPVQDRPNLYMARPGSAPRFVATLESSLSGPQPPPTVLSYKRDFGSFLVANGVAADPPAATSTSSRISAIGFANSTPKATRLNSPQVRGSTPTSSTARRPRPAPSPRSPRDRLSWRSIPPAATSTFPTTTTTSSTFSNRRANTAVRSVWRLPAVLRFSRVPSASMSPTTVKARSRSSPQPGWR